MIVILVIGILSAIALPTLAGHRDKGHDALAKSDTAVVAAQMEQCRVETDDFRDCNTAAKLDAEIGSTTGAVFGNGAGEVQVQQATRTSFRLRARSPSGSAYTLVRPATGPVERTCTPKNRGGCPPSGDW